MQKMLIQLDEERINAEGKYDIEKMWKVIDSFFEEGECIKEVLPDGAVMYHGNPKKPNYLAYFGMAYAELEDIEWFVKYVSKWIWYENSNDASQDFLETDCKIRMGK